MREICGLTKSQVEECYEGSALVAAAVAPFDVIQPSVVVHEVYVRFGNNYFNFITTLQ